MDIDLEWRTAGKLRIWQECYTDYMVNPWQSYQHPYLDSFGVTRITYVKQYMFIKNKTELARFYLIVGMTLNEYGKWFGAQTTTKKDRTEIIERLT